jgi:hypothetical protein
VTGPRLLTSTSGTSPERGSLPRAFMTDRAPLWS